MKKAFILGAIFGIIAPFLGFFIGLQFSPTLGSILMFPSILISEIADIPFGKWSLLLRIIGFISSIILWGLLFIGVTKIVKMIRK